MAMDTAYLNEKFHRTKQDKEKLRIAVALCLHGSDEEAPTPDVERYLRLRQRPAAEFLIQQGDLTGMRRLAAKAWFETKYLPDYMRMAQEAGRAELVAYLLGEWYGAGRKECGTDPGRERGTSREDSGEEKRKNGRGAADGETERFSRGDAAAENGRKKGDMGQMAREILQLTIQILRQRFPFLGGALLALEPVPMEEERRPAGESSGKGDSVKAKRTDRIVALWGTDGEKLYYDPHTVCRLFRQDPCMIEYLTLHSLFHCLFGHIFWPCGDRETEEADQAADRMVGEQLSRMTGEEESRYADCHDFWPSRRKSCTGTDPEHTEFLRSRWKYVAAGGGAGGMGAIHGQNGGELSQAYGSRKRKSYDYRRFLEQFMVHREERLMDTENFDPIWYHYSRSQYEGLVFLEPLETREVTRLEEIMIAIDTSASCSGNVVERFLDETFAILERQEHFFHKMNVHIVQCDCMIQDHVRITCGREWREYREHLKIRGLGDTDFTPVFTLARELERTGQVKRLKGILYFTDGDGIFPRKAPPWPSAFVFLNRELEKHELPDWAIRLNLSES